LKKLVDAIISSVLVNQGIDQAVDAIKTAKRAKQSIISLGLNFASTHAGD
jgi:hypothetical protein